MNILEACNSLWFN